MTSVETATGRNGRLLFRLPPARMAPLPPDPRLDDAHRLSEGSHHRNHPAPISARLELLIDRTLHAPATRDTDVLRIRIFPKGEAPTAERMSFTDHSDVTISKQPLNPNLRSGLSSHADVELDPAPRAKPPHPPGPREQKQREQAARSCADAPEDGAKTRHESLTSANDKRPFQRLQVKRPPRSKQGIRSLHDLADCVSHGFGPRSRNQFSPRPHQDWIVQFLPYSPRVRLIADGLRCIFSAAATTLPSVNRQSKAVRRFRSIVSGAQ